ncbi:MAG TPA: transposase [Actinomycetota bacterium]|nr:transposase [Actinomycetota bacterium]
MRAKEATVRLACSQLLLLHGKRRAWKRRMGELLAAPPEVGWEAEGKRFPGGEVYRSFPGLGARLAARVAGEIGHSPWQFETPNPLASYAGEGPGHPPLGRSELVVASRLVCNRHLSNALQGWAFCSLRASGWARALSDAQRARGKGHHAPSGPSATGGSRSCGTACAR